MHYFHLGGWDQELNFDLNIDPCIFKVAFLKLTNRFKFQIISSLTESTGARLTWLSCKSSTPNTYIGLYSEQLTIGRIFASLLGRLILGGAYYQNFTVQYMKQQPRIFSIFKMTARSENPLTHSKSCVSKNIGDFDSFKMAAGLQLKGIMQK